MQRQLVAGVGTSGGAGNSSSGCGGGGGGAAGSGCSLPEDLEGSERLGAAAAPGLRKRARADSLQRLSSKHSKVRRVSTHAMPRIQLALQSLYVHD